MADKKKDAPALPAAAEKKAPAAGETPPSPAPAAKAPVAPPAELKPETLTDDVVKPAEPEIDPDSLGNTGFTPVRQGVSPAAEPAKEAATAAAPAAEAAPPAPEPAAAAATPAAPELADRDHFLTVDGDPHGWTKRVGSVNEAVITIDGVTFEPETALICMITDALPGKLTVHIHERLTEGKIENGDTCRVGWNRQKALDGVWRRILPGLQKFRA